MVRRHKRIEKSKIPIEEIIAKTPIDEDLLRRRVWMEGVVLALPLFLSLAFYVNIISKTTRPVASAQLSQSGGVQPLAFFVFAFMIIYSIFLVLQYKTLNKKLKEQGKGYLKK